MPKMLSTTALREKPLASGSRFQRLRGVFSNKIGPGPDAAFVSMVSLCLRLVDVPELGVA